MNDQHYRVSIGTYDIDLEELHHPAGAAPISFVPVVAGAGAVGRIIAGIAFACFPTNWCWCSGNAAGTWRCISFNCVNWAPVLLLAASPNS
jgi:predicted phage tail protein